MWFAATRCSSGWRTRRRTWSTSRGSPDQKGPFGSCSTPQRRATQEGAGRGPRSRTRRGGRPAPKGPVAGRGHGARVVGPPGAAGALLGDHVPEDLRRPERIGELLKAEKRLSSKSRSLLGPVARRDRPGRIERRPGRGGKGDDAAHPRLSVVATRDSFKGWTGRVAPP
jgi:hypothetical protein